MVSKEVDRRTNCRIAPTLYNVERLIVDIIPQAPVGAKQDSSNFSASKERLVGRTTNSRQKTGPGGTARSRPSSIKALVLGPLRLMRVTRRDVGSRAAGQLFGRASCVQEGRAAASARRISLVINLTILSFQPALQTTLRAPLSVLLLLVALCQPLYPEWAWSMLVAR